MKPAPALGLLFALVACSDETPNGTDLLLRTPVAHVDDSPLLADELALQLLRQYGGILSDAQRDWVAAAKASPV